MTVKTANEPRIVSSRATDLRRSPGPDGPERRDGGNSCRPASRPTDDRFRRLLGDAQWYALPEAVRARFGRHVAPGELRLFIGRIVRTRHSRAGAMLAQLARLVGGPLPHARDATGPATVVVAEDAGLGGQTWTRTYAVPGRFPQTIVSVKRFSGPTGLEEYLGAGLVMRLTLSCRAGALVFTSAGYDLLLGRLRIALPRWLSPGRCTITHCDEGCGTFSFTLVLDHPRLGRLVEQVAIFTEIATPRE